MPHDSHRLFTLFTALTSSTAAIDRTNGGLFSGCDEAGHNHTKKEWWSQAETVVGFYNAYELSGERKYFDAADSVWSYIQNHFVDCAHGEWYNELILDNTPDTSLPKAGFWKCPYYNASVCFEVMITKRINSHSNFCRDCI